MAMRPAYVAAQPPWTTPPQGWRSWNAFYLDINEQRIYAQAEAMVRPMEGQNTPLSNAGFRSIGIDDGWQACGSGVNGSFHNAHGVPLVNESRFPDLARLNAKIHALGLKSGWYLGTTAGATSCSSVVARTCFRTPRPLARMTLMRRRSMDAGPPTISPDGATALREHGLQLENCGDSRPPDAQPRPAPMLPQWAVPTPSELGEHCDFGMYRVSADIAPQFMSGTSAQPPCAPIASS